MAYKYFLYSQQQVNDRNSMLDKINRVLKLGTVITGGKKKEFSALSDKPELPRYSDVRVIAEGDTENMSYVMPSSVQKFGNEV